MHTHPTAGEIAFLERLLERRRRNNEVLRDLAGRLGVLDEKLEANEAKR